MKKIYGITRGVVGIDQLQRYFQLVLEIIPSLFTQTLVVSIIISRKYPWDIVLKKYPW